MAKRALMLAKASRATDPEQTARSKAQGFDTDKVWYHSSLSPLDKFDAHGKFMGRSGTAGIHLTDSPEAASRYLDRYGDVDYKGRPFQKNIIPVYVKAGKVLERNEPFKSPIGLGMPVPDNYESPVKKMGYDALLRRESINKRGNSVGHVEPGGRGSVDHAELVLHDPSRVRSVFAQYDPDATEGPELSRAAGGSATKRALMIASEPLKVPSTYAAMEPDARAAWKTDQMAREGHGSFSPPGTPEREENFNRWNNRSKVRDGEGNPLRLYHATPKSFDTFLPGGTQHESEMPSGPATWLSPYPDKQPAGHHVGGYEGNFKSGTNVMPVHADIRNPLVIDNKGMRDWARQSYAKGSGEFPLLISPETRKMLLEDGYDGIFWAGFDATSKDEAFYGDHGIGEHPSKDEEIIALHPPGRAQIKSAIGNRGQYDPEDLHVNYARGGGAAESKDVRRALMIARKPRQTGGSYSLNDVRAGGIGPSQLVEEKPTFMGMRPEQLSKIAAGAPGYEHLQQAAHDWLADNPQNPPSATVGDILQRQDMGYAYADGGDVAPRAYRDDSGQFTYEGQPVKPEAPYEGPDAFGQRWRVDDMLVPAGETAPDQMTPRLTFRGGPQLTDYRIGRNLLGGGRDGNTPFRSHWGLAQGGAVENKDIRRALMIARDQRALLRRIANIYPGPAGGMDPSPGGGGYSGPGGGKYIGPSRYADGGGVDDYGGEHRPPGPEDGAPLHDLTGQGRVYPDDIYGPNAARYYGHGDDPLDHGTMSIIRQFKGRPSAMAAIYRAVPAGITTAEKLADLEKDMAANMRRGVVPEGESRELQGSVWYNKAHAERARLRALPPEPETKTNINPGDWVTINRQYAKDHGESTLRGKYKIVRKTVRADELYTDGNSIHEYGYWPRTQRADGGSVPPFKLYSGAAKIIGAKGQAKATPQQYAAMPGIKPDELKHSKFDTLGSKALPREEVIKHLEDNALPLEETTYTGDDEQSALRRYGEGKTALPGGKNYREVLLHAPSKDHPAVAAARARHKKALAAFDSSLLDQLNDNSQTSRADHDLREREAMQAGEELKQLKARHGTQDYKSSHWDQPNVVAHTRMSDRVGPNGEKVLHVEEVQSDWGQQGRERGFGSEQIVQQPSGTWSVVAPNGDASHGYATRELAERNMSPAGLPRGPYVDNTQKWTDLALKRVLHEAAHGGYDKIVVTPGDEQNKRYDLSSQVKNIQYYPDTKYLGATTHDNRGVEHEGVEPDDLSKHIGKEAADRILKQPLQRFEGRGKLGGEFYHELEGEGLKVGGEGMRGYYDNILPKRLQALAQQHDPQAKVQLGSTPVADDTAPLHSLDVTPQMRDSIKAKGFSHFKRGGDVDVAKKPSTPAIKKTLDLRPAEAFPELATRYPKTAPPEWAFDPKKKVDYLAKRLSPEALAVQTAKKVIQKDIEEGRYKPYFDPLKRYDASSPEFGAKTPTTNIKKVKPETQAKYDTHARSPEAIQRLSKSFERGMLQPREASDWYLMGQLHNEYVAKHGPKIGSQLFKERFADAMSATTGGADPTSNFLTSHYGNYVKTHKQQFPEKSYDLPFPIGGRYIGGNIDQFNKMIMQGKGVTPANPKRYNFSHNFLGDASGSTIDEQMSGQFDPKMTVPPEGTYGHYEEALADLAKQTKGAKSPRHFQEVAWAGAKDLGTKGGYRASPMISHINQSVERTSRLTGLSPDEVVAQNLVDVKGPMFQKGGAVGRALDIARKINGR